MNTPFETETCTRCGGSGSHSFNLTHGRVCFGCGGRKVKLTVRGLAAQKYYRDMFMTPAKSLEAGDWICPGATGTRAKIINITRHEESDIEIHLKTSSRRVVGSELFYKLEHQELFDQRQKAALDYQSTLTKAGKPRKIRAKKAA